MGLVFGVVHGSMLACYKSLVLSRVYYGMLPAKSAKYACFHAFLRTSTGNRLCLLFHGCRVLASDAAPHK